MTRGPVAGIGIAAALGCGGAERREAPVTEAPDAEAPVTQAPETDWIVAGHRAPGVSAMSDADAKAWHGRAIRFGAAEAISNADTCAQAAYQEVDTPADSFLGIQYHIRAVDLGLEPLRERRLRVIVVSCQGKPWSALGGVVLETAPDRRWAMRDGVFFELHPVGPGTR